jgi:ribosome biogenesis protein ERB1
MDLVGRIRKGHFPDASIDPHPEYIEWMKYDDHIHPLSSAPEPKRCDSPMCI